MSDYITTFKRYEKKYMLTKSQYLRLRGLLGPYVVQDQYARYTICNIYYDTDNYAIIRRSLEKPVYKEKLRLRSYGVPGPEDQIYFELKKKYKNEVFKRRISLTPKSFRDYQEKGISPAGSTQISSEIKYFMKQYNPHPSVFIAYERTAFAGMENPNLRITFDENIRFRETELNLAQGDHGTKILGNNQYLMEVKVGGAMPVWLSQFLSELQIYPTSFSKYGFTYQNYLAPLRDSLHTALRISAS